MTRLWHLQLFLHPETFREQVHAQVTSPVRYSYGTRKTRLLAKGKRLLMETRTQSTTTTTTQPQMSRSVCVNTPTPLGRTEADFQRAALRFFFFFFPKLFSLILHTQAPLPSRVASKASAPVVIFANAHRIRRVCLKEPQKTTLLRTAHFTPPEADLLRIVCWLPSHTWGFLK